MKDAGMFASIYLISGVEGFDVDAPLTCLPLTHFSRQTARLGLGYPLSLKQHSCEG